MKIQDDRTETAKSCTKKEYKKPVFNKFGRVADLTTSGSGDKKENHPGIRMMG
jgi:hypothetical protein